MKSEIVQQRLRGKLQRRRGSTLISKALLLAAFCTLLFVLVPSAQAQQQTKVPKVGLLRGRASASGTSLDGVLRELRALGYVDDKNIAFESRSAENKLDRLPFLAEELVGLKVDLFSCLRELKL